MQYFECCQIIGSEQFRHHESSIKAEETQKRRQGHSGSVVVALSINHRVAAEAL